MGLSKIASQVSELPKDGQTTPTPSVGVVGDPPVNPTPVSGLGTILEEMLVERFEHLRTQILEKR